MNSSIYDNEDDDDDNEQQEYDLHDYKKSSKMTGKGEQQRWNEGYPPPAERGPEWQCDCRFGNPRPGVIDSDYTKHEKGCVIRRRLMSSQYGKKVHAIYGTSITWT